MGILSALATGVQLFFVWAGFALMYLLVHGGIMIIGVYILALIFMNQWPLFLIGMHYFSQSGDWHYHIYGHWCNSYQSCVVDNWQWPVEELVKKFQSIKTP